MTIKITISHVEPTSDKTLAVAPIDAQGQLNGGYVFLGPGESRDFHVHLGQGWVVSEARDQQESA